MLSPSLVLAMAFEMLHGLFGSIHVQKTTNQYLYSMHAASILFMPAIFIYRPLSPHHSVQQINASKHACHS